MDDGAADYTTPMMLTAGHGEEVNAAAELERARARAEATRAAGRRLSLKLGAVATLYGEPTANALERAVEEVTENAGEAAWHFERAILEVDRVNSDLRAEAVGLRCQIGNAEREIPKVRTATAEPLLEALTTALGDMRASHRAALRYFRSARRRPTPWVRELGYAVEWLEMTVAENRRALEPDEEPF